MVLKWTLPIYSAVHFLPLLFGKRGALKRAPVIVFKRAAVGTLRSSLFLGSIVAVYQGMSPSRAPLDLPSTCILTICHKGLWCLKHNLHRFLTIARMAQNNTLAKLLPQWLIDVLVSKASYWVAGAVSGLSLLIEAQGRRGEMVMYLLPKALESAWVMMRGRGYAPKTGQWGDSILAGLGMGMIMVCLSSPHCLADS